MELKGREFNDGVCDTQMRSGFLQAGLPSVAMGDADGFSFEQLIERLFTSRPANPDQRNRYQAIEESFKGQARLLVRLSPHGPDLTVALRKLADAKMAFIQNIACNEK